MVCNAASNPYFGPLTGLKDEVFAKIMQNNVMSNLWLMNMVGPEMAERKDGAFIIVSSIGALIGSAYIAAYNMRKAADLSLVKSLAMEWGKHNIRVNCHRAGSDPDRLRQGLVGQSPDPPRQGEQGGAEADRPARRYRRRRGLPRFEGRRLCLRPVHHRRRRRDRHWCGVGSPSSRLMSGGAHDSTGDLMILPERGRLP